MVRLLFKYELLTPSSLRERSKTRFLVFVFFKKCILLVQHPQNTTKNMKSTLSSRPLGSDERTAPLSKQNSIVKTLSGNFSGFGPNPLSLRDTAVFRYLSTIIEVANNVMEILFLLVLED